jgi:hypothetical protein
MDKGMLPPRVFTRVFPPNPQFSPLPTSIATIPRIASKSHLTLILEHPQ